MHPDCRLDIRTSFLGNVLLEGNNSIEKDCIIDSTNIGYASYIGYGGRIYQTEIGRFCCIGRNLKIIQGQHPTTQFVSLHPLFYRETGYGGISFIEEQRFEENRWVDKENKIAVKVGNDVWIGDNVSIMEGVTVHDGAVIAAGAVVTKDVLPYYIVGGVPAKFIKKRFSDKEIDFLERDQWWNNSLEWLAANINEFQDISNYIKKFSGQS